MGGGSERESPAAPRVALSPTSPPLSPTLAHLGRVGQSRVLLELEADGAAQGGPVTALYESEGETARERMRVRKGRERHEK